MEPLAVQDRSRAVAAWSVGVCAGAAALTVFIRIQWLLYVVIVIAFTSFVLSMAAGLPDLLAFTRARMGHGANALEVIVRRQFETDWENDRGCFTGAQVIAQNNSSADVLVTKLGLTPVGFSAPTKLLGANLPDALAPGMALIRTILPIDVDDILGLTSQTARPVEPRFAVYLETGYGSAARRWTSEPFSLIPSGPFTGEYSGWTELHTITA
jgi:hypothetical protein